MTTQVMIRRAIKAVTEAICDTPGSAPALTDSLLKLVEAEAKHVAAQGADSPEGMSKIAEALRQVKELRERLNLVESVAGVKRLT